jgi:hypothetical protein
MAVQSPRKSQFANVRSAESGTVTLTSSDYRWQIFNPSGALTVKLPSSGIVAGDRFVIQSNAAQVLTLQTSSALEVTRLQSKGYVEYVALVNSPTAVADWLYITGQETVQSGITSVSLPTNNTQLTLITMNLGAGLWTITGHAASSRNNGGFDTRILIKFVASISLTPANAFGDDGSSYMSFNPVNAGTAIEEVDFALPPVNYNFSALTPVYLGFISNTSGSGTSVRGALQATRR